MEDSFDYVVNMLYDETGKYKPPAKTDNLYYNIQTLVYLYQRNPDWPDVLKEDMFAYVQECTNLLEKN